MSHTISNTSSNNDLQDRIDLSRDIATSRREIAEGKGIPPEEVMNKMRDMLLRLKAKREAAGLPHSD